MIHLTAIANIPDDVKRIICELKARELRIQDVPCELELNMDIIRTERNLGLRKSCHRGFDVIEQEFFVEEQWFYYDLSDEFVPSCVHKQTFRSFKEYYEFLDGDIYRDACYYQYGFEDDFSKGLNLDIKGLNVVKSFTTETIDDHLSLLSKDEVDEYKNYEKMKRLVKQWLKKFIACDTYEQFLKVCRNYKKSAIARHKNIDFFFFQYAFDDQRNKKHLEVIMKYLSNDADYFGDIASGLCVIYAPEEILDRYDFKQASVATNKKRKRNLKYFIGELKEYDVEMEVRGYFDKITHFYCEEMKT